MKKAMLIINPTSGGEKALDYKEKLENKAKEYFEQVDTKITEKRLMQHILLRKLLVSSTMQWLCLVVMGLSMKSFRVLLRETTFLS